jgi:hypothetical protein
MDKDSQTNRNIIMSTIQEVNNWRRSKAKFGIAILPVDGTKKVGVEARKTWEAQAGLRARSVVYVDDTAFFDDRDLPPVEVLRPDTQVSSL